MSVFPRTESQRIRIVRDAYIWHLKFNYVLYLRESAHNNFELWARDPRDPRGTMYGNVCLGLLTPAKR
jgi:hypothetical protein